MKYAVHRQGGTVLVTVLMMFAVAAVIATEMTYRQKLDVRRTSAMLMTGQAREYLLGAEELARLALRQDAADDATSKKPIDSLGEEWARDHPPFPVDGGTVHGRVVDLQGRFNINSLVKMEPNDRWVADPEHKTIFINLLKFLKLPDNVQPELVYERLVDYMDSDDDQTGADGMEDASYGNLAIPRRTPNQPLRSLTELRSVEGMTAELYSILEPVVCAIPSKMPININTAPRDVLLGLGVTRIDEFMAARIKAPLSKPDAIKPYMGNSGDADKIIKLMGVNSEFFQVESSASVGGRTVFSRSILYRSRDSSGNSDKITVVSRVFVDPLQQIAAAAPVNRNNGQQQ